MKKNEILAPYASYEIGGPADFFIEPENIEQLRETLDQARNSGTRVHVIGAGTNLLIHDEGVRGLVVRIASGFSYCSVNINAKSKIETRIAAGAGLPLSELVRRALDAGLEGLVFAGNIPGGVGGGIRMNAGAYGRSLGEAVQRVAAMDAQGKVRRYSRDECDFAYRSSRFKDSGEIIIEVDFLLNPGDRAEMRAALAEDRTRRETSHPLGVPSCGSVFKNAPPVYAGKLIEEAGLKGFRIGDAEVSERHANFIVNRGAAKAADVLAVIDHVREAVMKKSGVALELEVVLLGWD